MLVLRMLLGAVSLLCRRNVVVMMMLPLEMLAVDESKSRA
jgi:hypothetical protein